MVDEFKIIAITPESPREDEIDWIHSLLTDQCGVVSRVHIRHPGYGIRPILKSLSPEILSRISIHDNVELLREFDEIGFHFNSWVSQIPVEGNRTVSKSCHSWEEVTNAGGFDYVTLSPIYDSLSKKDYKSNKSLLTDFQKADVDVIALGGVTLENISTLKGFDGAAMIGTFDIPLIEIPNRLKIMKEKVLEICFNS